MYGDAGNGFDSRCNDHIIHFDDLSVLFPYTYVPADNHADHSHQSVPVGVSGDAYPDKDRDTYSCNVPFYPDSRRRMDRCNAKKIAGLIMIMISVFLLSGGLYITTEMVSQFTVTILIVSGLLLLIAGFVLYKLTDNS